jgi:hypothetical protein
MPPKEVPLAHRIHTDPALREIIKLVGYRGISVPITDVEYNRLREKFGKERLVRASEELVDIDTENRLAKLKADVRRLCQAILGPAPEEWDSFYEGIENPPPNPYTAEPAPTKRKRKSRRTKQEIDVVADAVANAIREETGMNVEVRTPDSLEDLQLEVLEDQLHNARLRCLTSKTTKAQNRANREVQGPLAEYERRKSVPPPERAEESPTPLAAEPKPQTFDVAGFRDFSMATNHRLKELLDMCQYELTRNDFDTVTYKEAVRDIGLIEAELRRRKVEIDEWAGAGSVP